MSEATSWPKSDQMAQGSCFFYWPGLIKLQIKIKAVVQVLQREKNKTVKPRLNRYIQFLATMTREL